MEDIKLIDVTKRYGALTVFERFSLTLPAGEISCILGRSGVGKTTLFRMLAGLTPYEGKICGTERGVAYVFQEPRLLPNLTVFENLALVLPKGSAGAIEAMLSQVGLAEKRDCYPHALSGGQARRVALARAFLYPADVILMDEPFASLDLGLKLKLIRLFVTLWQSAPKTVLCITHDPDELALLAQNAFYLEQGRITLKARELAPYPREYGEASELKAAFLPKILAEEG